ncbi:hypothetical protein GCWU000324_02073 [Kingella oralis ATCC 51147]|uniref:Uncharacterized protein n=1 Tax=Kingella oralis ATCC 51147 TaxID=629741 RepID=C4GJ51_9NEIS|nr:hypothetical protein GCWU000324_02073 [Kingella oralis ATCC 51147]
MQMFQPENGYSNCKRLIFTRRKRGYGGATPCKRLNPQQRFSGCLCCAEAA